MNIFHQATNKYSYSAFLELCRKLLAEGRTTSFSEEAEYIHYAKLNLQRMDRLNKTFHLPEEYQLWLQTLPPQEWWLITEGWCGDSAQSLPVIHKMAEATNGNIRLIIILREENPAIMNQYLTHGSRSIPVLVLFENDRQVGRWGPRPVKAQELFDDLRGRVEFEELEVQLQQWYNGDKGQETMAEIKKALDTR